MQMMEFIQGSVLILFVSLLVFHLVSAVYCLKKQSSKAIFSNSKLILCCSILFNVIEITLSLVQGECVSLVFECSRTAQLYLTIILIFTGNLFYMTIFLRAHRLLLLSSLESGHFSLGSLERLKAQLGDLWYLLIITGGSFVLSSPYASYLTYEFSKDSSVLGNLEVYEIFMGATVSFECILLIIVIFPLLYRNIPVILKVELWFQLISWASALFVLRNSVIQRFFFLIPIRNFTMMLVIIVSIYEVNKNFKPPLPPEIDLELILESEELYQSFKKFLDKRRMEESSELLNILLKIRIFKETTGSFDGRVLIQCIKSANCIGHLLKDILIEAVDKGHHDGYQEAEEFCFKKLEDGPFKLFRVSEEYIDALSEY